MPMDDGPLCVRQGFEEDCWVKYCTSGSVREMGGPRDRRIHTHKGAGHDDKYPNVQDRPIAR